METTIIDNGPDAAMTTAIHRVAVFQFVDDGLVQNVAEAGLEVAYFYSAEFGTEHVDFEDIPAFDLLAASLPDGDPERKRAFELVLMFLRARSPISFVLAGKGLDEDGFSEMVREKTRPLGYTTDRSARTGGSVFIIGTLPDTLFEWPRDVVPIPVLIKNWSDVKIAVYLEVIRHGKSDEEALDNLVECGFHAEEVKEILRELRAEEEG